MKKTENFRKQKDFEKRRFLVTSSVKRFAHLGHKASQEEVWIYQVNRGCLYLRIGRVDEAEQLLKEALPNIDPRRRVYHFFKAFHLLARMVDCMDKDIETAREKAQRAALITCLRTYRGVPDLEKAGVCYTKDVVYLRGLRRIEEATTRDEAVLDQLAVGKIALELLPDVQELGITAPQQTLRKLAFASDLDTYILTFEASEPHSLKDAKKNREYA